MEEIKYDIQEVQEMGLINCSKVYVSKCEYGLGVFAKEFIQKGEVIETGLMIRLKNVDGNENPHLHTWSDDRKVWGMPTGCFAFYNHSENPNIKKIGDLKNDTIIVVALRDIEENEELKNTYYSSKWRSCFKDLQ